MSNSMSNMQIRANTSLDATNMQNNMHNMHNMQSWFQYAEYALPTSLMYDRRPAQASFWLGVRASDSESVTLRARYPGLRRTTVTEYAGTQAQKASVLLVPGCHCSLALAVCVVEFFLDETVLFAESYIFRVHSVECQKVLSDRGVVSSLIPQPLALD